MAFVLIDDKLYQEVEDDLAKAGSRRKKRPGVRVWQQGKKRLSSKVDPFATLVFIYLILSVACLLWFGWKYYVLKREVARLSEIVVNLFEEKAAAPTVYLPDQKEPANDSLPAATAIPDRPETAAAASPLPAKSTMYTVKEGDTWWKISQNNYGSGNYYLKLTAYNKMNNQPLYKGQVVEIPPKEVLDALQ